MPRELFCRYDDCRVSVVSCAGIIPVVCPGCHRSSRWSTTPRMSDHGEPMVPYEITVNDRRFLKSLRIASEN
jgi:hypothetical protein